MNILVWNGEEAFGPVYSRALMNKTFITIEALLWRVQSSAQVGSVTRPCHSICSQTHRIRVGLGVR